GWCVVPTAVVFRGGLGPPPAAPPLFWALVGGRPPRSLPAQNGGLPTSGADHQITPIAPVTT
ncbi:MAG: hypothetical protein ACT4OP_08035, partial [Actinomycetota bacterium]